MDFPHPLRREGSDRRIRYLERGSTEQTEGSRNPTPGNFHHRRRRGFVRLKNVWENYKKRTSPDIILRELDKLND